jgi:hypothetical protein
LRSSSFVALAIWLAIGTVAVVAAQSGLETPSPATGSAQVISQGMTNRPALRSAWRVVERQIPIRAEARPSDRLEGSAGFLLADAAPIFVTDQDTKQRYRLAPGEAQFVPIGANQTWASLDDQPTTAYTLELAVRDNIDEANGEIVYRSGSFGMLEGDYDLDLVRNTLPYNRRAQVEGSEFPILVFVTQGQIDVVADADDGEPERLHSGEGGAYQGNIRIQTKSRNEAIYVVAIVTTSIGGGRTVGQPSPSPEPTSLPTETATPEPSPTPDPDEELVGGNVDAPQPTPRPTFESRTGTSEIRIELRLCPAGMTAESFDPDECARARGGFNLALVTPFGETLRLRHANRYDDDYVRWSQLKSGIYLLEVRAFPEGYVDWALDGFPCCTDGEGFEIRLGRGDSVIGTIYFFRPE